MWQLFKSETIYSKRYLQLFVLLVFLDSLVRLGAGKFDFFKTAGVLAYIIAASFTFSWYKSFKTEKRNILSALLPSKPIKLGIFRALFVMFWVFVILLSDYFIRLLLFSADEYNLSLMWFGVIILLHGSQALFDDIKRIFPHKDDYYILIGITITFTIFIAINVGFIYLLDPLIKNSDWFLYLIFIFWGTVFTGASIFTFTKRRLLF